MGGSCWAVVLGGARVQIDRVFFKPTRFSHRQYGRDASNPLEVSGVNRTELPKTLQVRGDLPDEFVCHVIFSENATSIYGKSPYPRIRAGVCYLYGQFRRLATAAGTNAVNGRDD